MHMAGGETSTRAQEVTEGFVSVVSGRCYDCTRAVQVDVNRCWEHSRMGIYQINLTLSMNYGVYK